MDTIGIDVGVAWLMPYLPGVILHMVRAGAFLSVIAIFGSGGDSRWLRMILMVAMGVMMWWTTGPDSVPMVTHPLDMVAMVSRELVLGLILGFAVRSMIVVLGIAGEVISHEMGFSMARIMNPDTGSASTPLAQLFETMGILLIFQLNLHHEVLRLLKSTYELVPVGKAFNYDLVFERLGTIIASAIEYGLQYAIPIFGVMILLTVTLVVLARAVQNINLMEFSFALRIMLGLSSSIYFLFEGVPFLERVFGELIGNARMMLVGA